MHVLCYRGRASHRSQTIQYHDPSEAQTEVDEVQIETLTTRGCPLFDYLAVFVSLSHWHSSQSPPPQALLLLPPRLLGVAPLPPAAECQGSAQQAGDII